jgi:hypothetical protein
MKSFLLTAITFLGFSVQGEEILFSITTTHRETAAWETEVVSVESCAYKDRMIYSQKIVTPRATFETVFIEGKGYHRKNYGKWILLQWDADTHASKYKQIRSFIFLDESFLMECDRTKEIDAFIADQQQKLSSLELDEASYEAFEGVITSYRQKPASHRSSLVQRTNFVIETFPYSDLLNATAKDSALAANRGSSASSRK